MRPPPSPSPGEDLPRSRPLPFVLPWPTTGPAAQLLGPVAASLPLPLDDLRHRLHQQQGAPRVKQERTAAAAAASRTARATMAANDDGKGVRVKEEPGRSSAVPRDALIARGGGGGGCGGGGGGDSGGCSTAAVDGAAATWQDVKPRLPLPAEAPHNGRPGLPRQSPASMTATLGGGAEGAPTSLVVGGWGRLVMGPLVRPVGLLVVSPPAPAAGRQPRHQRGLGTAAASDRPQRRRRRPPRTAAG